MYRIWLLMWISLFMLVISLYSGLESRIRAFGLTLVSGLQKLLKKLETLRKGK